jgi:hypothetical protein
MRYMLLSNIDGSRIAQLSPAENDALMVRFVAFTQALAESGVLRAGEALQPADTATTLRVRDGELVLTDGPFADVAEFFGGFWTVDVPDLDTALKHAGECPALEVGSVEVRPVAEIN